MQKHDIDYHRRMAENPLISEQERQLHFDAIEQILEKESNALIAMGEKTGIRYWNLEKMLASGHTLQTIQTMYEISTEYGVHLLGVRRNTTRAMKQGLPVEESLELAKAWALPRTLEKTGFPTIDYFIGLYEQFGTSEAVVQFAEFVKDNFQLIESAFPGEYSLSEKDPFERMFDLAFPVYELSGRDPEKAKETLHYIANNKS